MEEEETTGIVPVAQPDTITGDVEDSPPAEAPEPAEVEPEPETPEGEGVAESED